MGADLAFREWPGPGQPIVLIHGLASNKGIWDQVAVHLAKWRTIAFDLRGHGESDKPDSGYDFDTVVDDLREAMRKLGVEQPLVVGHSWGGNVALHLAAMPGGARGAVLVDGGFIELSRRMSWDEARERLRPPNTDVPVEEFRSRIRGRLGDLWSDAWESAVLGNFHVDSEGIIRRNLSIENHMRILEALYHHTPTALFKELICPALLIPAIPPDGGDATRLAALREVIAEAEQNPRVRTVWLEDTVHDVPLHRPARLAELIASLA